MKMVIGGAFQGKQAYVRTHFPEIENGEWVNGNEAEEMEIFTKKVIYNFHEYIRKRDLEDQKTLAARLIEENPDVILITDEIGYGLVPINAEDRAYREQVGRICTELAAFSDEVVRVVMGIGTKIKG